MNSPETVNTLAPQLHPSLIGTRGTCQLLQLLRKNPPRKSRIAWKQQLLAKHSSNRQRREFRHVRLRFLQSLNCLRHGECRRARLGRALTLPTCPLEGLEGHGINPQHTFGPSWSVRFLAAPRSMGPAVFRAHRQPTSTDLVPPGVCGPWPLLAVWDPRFSWAHRQPATQIWSLLECAAPGRSSQCGTRGFPGLTANPQHTFGPSWSARHLAVPAVWDPRFSRAHRQPQHT